MLINQHQDNLNQLNLTGSDSLIQLLNNAMMEYFVNNDDELSFAEPGLPVKIVYPVLPRIGAPSSPPFPLLNEIPSDANEAIVEDLHVANTDFLHDSAVLRDYFRISLGNTLSSDITNGIFDAFVNNAPVQININVCSTYLRRAYIRDIVSIRARNNHFTDASNEAGSLNILNDAENVAFYKQYSDDNFTESELSKEAFIEGLSYSDFVFIVINNKLFLYRYNKYINLRRDQEVTNTNNSFNNLDLVVSSYATQVNSNAFKAYEARVSLEEARSTITHLNNQVDVLNAALNDMRDNISNLDNYEYLEKIKDENRRLKDLERLIIRGHDSNGTQMSNLIYEQPIDAIFDIRNININSKSIFAKYRYNLQSVTSLDILERDWNKLTTSIIVDNKIPSSMLLSESAIGYTFSGKSEDLSLSAYNRNLGSAVKAYNTTSGIGTKITKVEYVLVLVDNQGRTYSVRVVIS